MTLPPNAEVEWFLANEVSPRIVITARALRTQWTQGELEDFISALQAALDEARSASDEELRDYRERLRLAVMP